MFDREPVAPWAREVQQYLKEHMSTAEYRSAAESAISAYYTPNDVMRAIWDTLSKMGFEGGRVLDPAAGIGNFAAAMPDALRAKSQIFQVELDKTSAGIAKALITDAVTQNAGFEDTRLENDSFDVVVGNVPFESVRIQDASYGVGNLLVHDYFFHKAINLVHPGGIVAFITTTGTLDKADSITRGYLADAAELVGAVRLPSSTFKASGAEVTTDIIFLKKREGRVDGSDAEWIKTRRMEDGYEVAPNVTDVADAPEVNGYYLAHRENVAGKLRVESGPHGPRLTVAEDDGKTAYERIMERTEAFEARFEGSVIAGDAKDLGVVPADPRARKFSYFIDDAGALWYRGNDTMSIAKLDKKAEARVRDLIVLRDKTRAMLDAELAGVSDEQISALQADLSDTYDAFVAKHKAYLHDDLISRSFIRDASAQLVLRLEYKKDVGEIPQKSELFTKRVLAPASAPVTCETAPEALIVSCQVKGRVDVPYIAELVNESEENVIEELKGKIFLNPDGSWETASEYLSGDVREKLARAREAAREDAGFEQNVVALERALPEDVPPEDIVADLGAFWIPERMVEDFATHLLGGGIYRYAGDSWPHVFYNKELALWEVTNKESVKTRYVNTTTWGTEYPKAGAMDLLELCLNMKDAVVKKTVYNPFTYESVRIVDREATALAQAKQDQIREEFRNWAFSDDRRRDQIVKEYNRLFNSYVERQYSADEVSFDGLNPEIHLREHQKEAVARQLYSGNTLLYQVVGAGKTFEMICAAQEGKRLGLHHKSLFAVPNHIIGQVGEDYIRLYPQAKVLVATKKDMEKKNRAAFFAKAATGDWDAIIIGHSHLQHVPVGPDLTDRYFENRIAELEESLALIVDGEGTRGSLLQSRIKAYRKKLQDAHKKFQDKSGEVGFFFEELGVDRLFVDEAHEFKNLGFATKFTNMFSNASKTTAKCENLLMICDWLNEKTKGRGLTFATGTAVSNTISELYSMQRYLQPDLLKKTGLIAFDAWASTFAKKVTSVETTPDASSYQVKERFSRYHNLPELMGMFRQVADIKTAENLPQQDFDRPAIIKENVVIEPSIPQEDYMQELSERSSMIKAGLVAPRDDNMLKITNDGRKVALDVRLVDGDVTGEAGAKLKSCADKVAEIYHETEERRSTQLVFCDLGVAGGSLAKEGMDIYQDLKDLLIARGVKEGEIAFAQDVDKDDREEKLYPKVRSGEIRVLLASTNQLATGTNVQNKLVAVHNLDIAWRPADDEQRTGRAVRPGNENKAVKIFRYVTNRTFDSFMYQTVERKQVAVGQLLNFKDGQRTIEEIDELALDYAEVKALVAGSPLVKEKMTLDIEVAKLATAQAAWAKAQRQLNENVKVKWPKRIEELKSQMEELEADMMVAKANPAKIEDARAPFVPSYGEKAGVPVSYGEAADICYAASREAISSGKMVEVGAYRGFKVFASWLTNPQGFDLVIEGKTRHSVPVEHRAGAMARIDNMLDGGFAYELKKSREETERLEDSLEHGRKKEAEPFAKAGELKQKRARLAEVDRELKISGVDNVLTDTESFDVDETGLLDFDKEQMHIVRRCKNDKLSPAKMAICLRPEYSAQTMEELRWRIASLRDEQLPRFKEAMEFLNVDVNDLSLNRGQRDRANTARVLATMDDARYGMFTDGSWSPAVLVAVHDEMFNDELIAAIPRDRECANLGTIRQLVMDKKRIGSPVGNNPHIDETIEWLANTDVRVQGSQDVRNAACQGWDVERFEFFCKRIVNGYANYGVRNAIIHAFNEGCTVWQAADWLDCKLSGEDILQNIPYAAEVARRQREEEKEYKPLVAKTSHGPVVIGQQRTLSLV